MFSFKYAFFCIAAGLLAGWSFDKKNDIPIVGIFTYLFVVSAFSLMFDYDQSWAFLAFIEMLAGHGLYKMGFGNFLGELFSTSELKKETNKVVTATKAAKIAYIERKDSRNINLKPELRDFNITKKDVEEFNENISKLKKYSFFGSLIFILIAPFPTPVLSNSSFGAAFLLTAFLLSFLYPLSFLSIKYISTRNNSNYDKCNKYINKLEKHNEKNIT